MTEGGGSATAEVCASDELCEPQIFTCSRLVAPKNGMESRATRDATSEKHHRRNDGKTSRPQAEIEEHKAKQRRMVSATNEEKRSRLLRRGHKQARIGPRNMHVTRWRMVRQNCRWTGRKHDKAWMTEAWKRRSPSTR